jgi:hypothetical protein
MLTFYLFPCFHKKAKTTNTSLKFGKNIWLEDKRSSLQCQAVKILIKLVLINIRGGFIKHLSPTQVAQQSVTKIISPTIMNLVTPKAGAKHELLFNKSALVC